MSNIKFKSFIIFTILSLALTGCSKVNIDLDNYDYKKEAIEEKSYPINGDKIIVKSDISDITIKKDNVSDIKVNLKKSVAGNKETKVDKVLEETKSEYDNGKITISHPKTEWYSFVSVNITTEIVVPNNISDLKIENDVGDITTIGDYKEVKLENDTGDIQLKGICDKLNIVNDIGDIDINGEAEVCDIKSDVGDINLNLSKIQDDYKYSVKNDVGSLEINLPKQSKIKLIGESKKHINMNSDIQAGNEGAEFDLDVSISDIKINGI